MQTKRKADDITEEIHEAATADADVAIVPVPDTTTATATPTVTIPEKVNDTNDSDPLEPKAAKDDDVGPQELDDDDKDDYDDIDSNPLGKRRFFPRVKHLLTREWEQVRDGEMLRIPFCSTNWTAFFLYTHDLFSWSVLPCFVYTHVGCIVSSWSVGCIGTSRRSAMCCGVTQAIQSLVQSL